MRSRKLLNSNLVAVGNHPVTGSEVPINTGAPFSLSLPVGIDVVVVAVVPTISRKTGYD